MCNPALLTAGLTAGQAIVGHQQASAQAKVQTALHKINQANAIKAMGQEQYTLGRREIQEREAAAQQVAERNIAALTSAAALNAQMAETGVVGNTMTSLMNDVFVKEGRANNAIKTNMQWSSENLAAQRVGARNKAISRAGSTAPGTPPSMLATGLKIGVAGATAWDSLKSN